MREVEDLRSTMIANLSKKTVPEEDTICISIQNETDEGNKQQKAKTKKTKKHASKKSPRKVKTNGKVRYFSIDIEFVSKLYTYVS